MKIKDRWKFRDEVYHILRQFTGCDYAPFVCEAIHNDVRKDVEECADENYNGSDIILAIGRTLTARLSPQVNVRKCCICHRPIVGHGHNAAPLRKSGIACDKCQHKVLLARIKETGRMMVDAEIAFKKGGKR